MNILNKLLNKKYLILNTFNYLKVCIAHVSNKIKVKYVFSPYTQIQIWNSFLSKLCQPLFAC